MKSQILIILSIIIILALACSVYAGCGCAAKGAAQQSQPEVQQQPLTCPAGCTPGAEGCEGCPYTEKPINQIQEPLSSQVVKEPEKELNFFWKIINFLFGPV